ncbi:peptidoglycan DD-metalloendopeptidase family protein [Salinarimonas chemoclinalis]|uniref:peptidoglycan DD-metalloendopeptidase family protein n=1 Tax=Salinarimonas chemoclinalis TaxID=3241599 RepID=UPI003557B87F
MALVALAAGALGACSADTMRFADPFGNPFATQGRDPVMTGSVDPAAAAPTTAVASAPLAAPGAVAPLPTGPATVAATQAPAPSGPPGWSALGGTPIIVRQGETAASLAGRYNVPVDALLRVNGLASAAEVQPGRAVVVPVFNAAGGTQVASAAPIAPSAQPSPPRTAAGPVPIQTGTVVASAPLPPRAPARSAAPVASAGQPVAQSPAQSPALQPTQPVAQAPAQQPSAPAAAPTQVASLPAATGLDFRWPARGRVISGFGTAGNEGINIAVPEGTPVRAAESGTVAYAGDELRGYGKLVLVRHDDGYVSAYAHNSELLVNRGDAVRRGQVIAHSGRTGNVTSPQLHFEIRQGADPVDPMPYLTN